MARYNREFLVPYLHNICALYLVMEKMTQMANYKEDVIEEYKNPPKMLPPTEPEYVSESIGGLGLVGILMAAGSIMAMCNGQTSSYGMDSTLNGMCVIMCIVGVILFIIGVDNSKQGANCNSTLQKQYEEEMDAYRQRLIRAEVVHQKNLQEIQRLENEVDMLDAQCDKAEEYLELLYSANVIPGKYRDMYAAVYLYDWFSTSGADDMDHALSMYVLEEIKSRLDRIIENQAEIILNQRIAIAMQQKSIQMQREHNQMMRQKLDKLQATEEERLQYDRMIEGNTAANAFFAAANYLK